HVARKGPVASRPEPAAAKLAAETGVAELGGVALVPQDRLSRVRWRIRRAEFKHDLFALIEVLEVDVPEADQRFQHRAVVKLLAPPYFVELNRRHRKAVDAPV